jgi:hypothetical protein
MVDGGRDARVPYRDLVKWTKVGVEHQDRAHRVTVNSQLTGIALPLM